MSDARTGDYYPDTDEIDRFDEEPSWDDASGDEVEPWWERFYDERYDYDPRDEVER